MRSVLRRRQIRRQMTGEMVREMVWAGQRFLEEDLQTFVREVPPPPSPLATLTAAAQEGLGRLWGQVPLSWRMVLQAGVLVPVGLVSLGYGLAWPDLDIRVLGIGWHRYFLFHSAAGAWLLREFAESYTAWVQRDPTAPRLQKVVAAVASAGAVGIALHLLKDALLDGNKSVVFGIPGLRVNTLVPGTYLDDDLWLVANGLWALKIARDVVALAFGEEERAVRAYLAEHFGWGRERR